MSQRKLFDKKTLDELRKHPLYSQDGKGNKAVAYAKIFNPYGRQTWYITEWDGDDTFFGYTDDGLDGELSYMSKKELENARVNVYGTRLPLERDAYYKPTNLGAIKNEIAKNNERAFNARYGNNSSAATNAMAGSKG